MQRAAPAPDARRARGEATRQRLLDAAELLFAEHGFKSVSMRDIATEAGVELSLTTHHFGSKQAMGEKVLLRRSDAVFGNMLAALERVENAGDPSPQDIFEAYIETFLIAIEHKEPGWTSYMKLVLKRAEEMSDAYEPNQPLMVRYRPLRLRYIRAIQNAAPGSDYASAAFSMTILEGALGYALFERSPSAFSDEAKRSRRIAQLLRRLAPFLAGGLQAAVQIEPCPNEGRSR